MNKLPKRKYEKSSKFPNKVKYFVNVKEVEKVDLGKVIPQKKVFNFEEEGIEPLGNLDEVMKLLMRLKTGW